MRIIAEGHSDYYDCVMRQGMDLTCVWLRRLEEVCYDSKKNREWPFPVFKGASYRWRNWWNARRVWTDQYIIGFCGKIYSVLELQPGKSRHLCWSLEDVDEFVRTEGFDKEHVDHYLNPEKSSNRARRTDPFGMNRKEIRKFFEDCQQQQTSFENVFVENGCPVFVAYYRSRGAKIVYHGRKENPDRPDDEPRLLKSKSDFDHVLLKDFDFFKLFPVQQAFQEIHQYLSGVLGFNNPHVPVPDDKTMRDIKGFDDRSFKKEPSKKRG